MGKSRTSDREYAVVMELIALLLGHGAELRQDQGASTRQRHKRKRLVVIKKSHDQRELLSRLRLLEHESERKVVMGWIVPSLTPEEPNEVF